MTTTPNNDTPRVGDLVELRKGEGGYFGRVYLANSPTTLYLEVESGTGLSKSVNDLIADGYTLTIKERATEPLPTAPGLYVARGDLAESHSPNIFSRGESGWDSDVTGEWEYAAPSLVRKVHETRGGLVRLVPEDAPRFSDEELDVLREVLDEAVKSGAANADDRARIVQARRILGLVPAEGSAK
ncbi:MAG TPA: hypothetical protein VFU07_07220 [Candidatus Lumbricidophila sp.]|nr:hypothetical protein [Candidatus Lumbricidophila sp.]